MVSLPQKREAVTLLMFQGLSERQACQIVQLHRSVCRYQSKRLSEEEELIDSIKTAVFMWSNGERSDFVLELTHKDRNEFGVRVDNLHVA